MKVKLILFYVLSALTNNKLKIYFYFNYYFFEKEMHKIYGDWGLGPITNPQY